ncbi:hypothetical protein DUT91_23565 [Phyllobacterium salinisoli]|uniref:CopL family metal-binding regulatory protein n=1 Tax=Phyllobacterium salinisoli TaxID=1899321 RepID=A0A368JWI6_9HYPH|nr:hypothetical protein DUT91_23565 [Phyllobacterium salinisoli]
MMRSLRPFLILLIALAFSVTGTSWSIASGSVAPGAGENHHALSAASLSSGQHEHGNRDFTQNTVCQKAESACAAQKQHNDLTGSCCAMACHTAIPTLGCDIVVLVFARIVERPLLEAGIEEAPATRLDRPPRSLGI